MEDEETTPDPSIPISKSILESAFPESTVELIQNEDNETSFRLLFESTPPISPHNPTNIRELKPGKYRLLLPNHDTDSIASLPLPTIPIPEDPGTLVITQEELEKGEISEKNPVAYNKYQFEGLTDEDLKSYFNVDLNDMKAKGYATILTHPFQLELTGMGKGIQFWWDRAERPVAPELTYRTGFFTAWMEKMEEIFQERALISRIDPQTWTKEQQMTPLGYPEFNFLATDEKSNMMVLVNNWKRIALLFLPLAYTWNVLIPLVQPLRMKKKYEGLYKLMPPKERRKLYWKKKRRKVKKYFKPRALPLFYMSLWLGFTMPFVHEFWQHMMRHVHAWTDELFWADPRVPQVVTMLCYYSFFVRYKPMKLTRLMWKPRWWPGIMAMSMLFWVGASIPYGISFLDVFSKSVRLNCGDYWVWQRQYALFFVIFLFG